MTATASQVGTKPCHTQVMNTATSKSLSANGSRMVPSRLVQPLRLAR